MRHTWMHTSARLDYWPRHVLQHGAHIAEVKCWRQVNRIVRGPSGIHPVPTERSMRGSWSVHSARATTVDTTFLK